jgi:hypothetical protein
VPHLAEQAGKARCPLGQNDARKGVSVESPGMVGQRRARKSTFPLVVIVVLAAATARTPAAGPRLLSEQLLNGAIPSGPL